MTPKILKAGLLVGALVFALVSCGQNTKPMSELPKSYTFREGSDRTKSYKISDVIKDKDSDSLTLSNFTSNNQAAWITLDKTSNPTSIMLNAANLAPGAGDQTAKVSFEVSDGTDKITVSMNVTVEAPDIDCMILDGDAIVPDLCPLGSVHMPYELTRSRSDASIDAIDIPLHRFPAFRAYANVAEADDAPNFNSTPVVVGGVRYLSGAPTLEDCDDNVDYDKNNTANDDEDCLRFILPGTPADRLDTPDGVTVMIEITAENDNASSNLNTDDDVTDIIHFEVKYS